MNKDCAIARDLMPQVIDGIASEESKAFVETHVEDCDSCTQVYADMQDEIQAMEATKATITEPSFKAAMAQLRKTMGWKRLKAAIVLTVVFIIAGYGGYYYLCEYTTYQDVRAMPLDVYEINLYQGSGNAVYGLVTMADNYNKDGLLITRNDENDNTILYFYWTAPVILVRKYGVPNSDHCFIMNMTMTENGGLTRDGNTIIREIRQGKPDNYRVVYRSGDAIPPMDPDIDAHYQIQDTFDQMDEAQQMPEDAEQMDIDAQIEVYDSLNQLESTEAVTPAASPAE